MNKVFLDTNAYSRFKQNDQAIIDIIQRSDEILLNPVVLGELLSGFASGSKELENKSSLKEFLESSRVKVLPIDESTSNYYSTIKSSLKQKGKPIPANDIWIAATVMQNGCLLCSYDKHFSFVDNLITVTSPSELI